MGDFGIFFILFQSQLNGYVKCWIDGSEDPEYMLEEEFKDLVRKAYNDDFIYKILDCISTTSIFLWDVMKKTIYRPTPIIDHSTIAKKAFEERDSLEKSNQLDSNPLSGVSYNHTTGRISFLK